MGQTIQNRGKNGKMHLKKKKVFMMLFCSAAILCSIVGGFFLHSTEEETQRVQTASASKGEVPGMEQQESVLIPNEVDPTKPMIALTFDDGPSQYTWDIVDILQKNRAHATFFLLGSRIATHQAAIDNVLANHNEIGSHSMDHKNLAKLSEEDILGQVLPVTQAMQEEHQYTVKLFRVPYGAKNDQVRAILKEQQFPIIGWSVDPYDWKVKNKQKIVEHVLNNAKDGDIVLMHDIYKSTAEAVSELVPKLEAQGFQLVTVSELFQFRGEMLQPGEVYRSAPRKNDSSTANS